MSRLQVYRARERLDESLNGVFSRSGSSHEVMAGPISVPTLRFVEECEAHSPIVFAGQARAAAAMQMLRNIADARVARRIQRQRLTITAPPVGTRAI